MPIYEFQCSKCSRLEEHFHKMSDDSQKTHMCPECNQVMSRKFSTNFAIKDGPSGVSPSKALREKNYRARRSEEMKKRQKDNVFTPTLQPNVKNSEGKPERFDTWSEAQSFAKDQGKNAESYEPLVKKEKKGT